MTILRDLYTTSITQDSLLKKQHSLKQICEQVYLHVLDKYFLIKLNHRAEQITYTYIMTMLFLFQKERRDKRI